jgi:anti-anti-sigma regulatory factor
MATEDYVQDTILVHLAGLPEMLDELDGVAKTIREGTGCDVIIDFSSVGIITTPVIARLISLRRLLVERTHQLVLHSVSQQIKGVFATTGLDQIFEFADDKHAALARVQHDHSKA